MGTSGVEGSVVTKVCSHCHHSDSGPCHLSPLLPHQPTPPASLPPPASSGGHVIYKDRSAHGADLDTVPFLPAALQGLPAAAQRAPRFPHVTHTPGAPPSHLPALQLQAPLSGLAHPGVILTPGTCHTLPSKPGLVLLCLRRHPLRPLSFRLAAFYSPFRSQAKQDLLQEASPTRQ